MMYQSYFAIQSLTSFWDTTLILGIEWRFYLPWITNPKG